VSYLAGMGEDGRAVAFGTALEWRGFGMTGPVLLLAYPAR